MTTLGRHRTVAPPAGRDRLLAGADSSPRLEHHLALYGPVVHPADLIDLVGAAGLLGRGGGAFPTAAKLDAVAGQRGRPVVVANGAEGEPASKKDRSLLRVAPHLVLDGAAVAARAIGAREVVVAVSHGREAVTAAVAERKARRLDPVAFSVRGVPDSFVAGEETALLRSIGGGPAKPTLKPPYPFEKGIGGEPTLVQNVETLAHIALIARFGPEWFGRGTALVTLGGTFRRPGVHEIELGSTLEQVAAETGGFSEQPVAFLVGGYFGRWYSVTDARRLQLTPKVLGAGAILALPGSTCAVAECARVVGYLASQSAGQCGPCVHGLAAMAGALDPSGRGDTRKQLARWAEQVTGRGACRHPDGAARFVASALDVFAEEFARHARHRGCGKRPRNVLPVPA